MIKSIIGGPFVNVIGGQLSRTYVSNGCTTLPNNKVTGDMVYDTNEQCIKVFDGASWIRMNEGYATVELNGDAQSLLQWARQKRNEEMERENLAQTNPAIKDLMNQIEEKQDQIKMVMTLLKSSGHSDVENTQSI
jgi:hypothetical protein